MSAVEKNDHHIKWKALIAEHEKSGLSQIEFCKQRNIKTSQFGYYRRIIKSQEHADKNQHLFSAVKIKKPEAPISSEIKIVLPNGFQCFIPSTLDALQVKHLMEALLSC